MYQVSTLHHLMYMYSITSSYYICVRGYSRYSYAGSRGMVGIAGNSGNVGNASNRGKVGTDAGNRVRWVMQVTEVR